MANTIPILVINLDRDTERLDYMRREFARVGLSFERLPGVCGTELPPELKPYFCDSEGAIASPLARGQIGCHASHIKAWMNVAGRDLGPAVLICEDDIKLPDNMPQLLDSLIAAAPPGWDIIRLSSPAKRSVYPVAALVDGYRLARFSRITVNAGAYLISRAGAEKMIRPGLRKNPLDVTISRPWVFGMDAYGVIPRIIIQNTDFESAIDRLGSRNDVRKRRTRVMRLQRRIRKIPTKVRRGVYNLKTMGPRHWLICLFQNARYGITGRKFEWS